MFGKIKSLDAYRNVPKDLTEQTVSGAIGKKPNVSVMSVRYVSKCYFVVCFYSVNVLRWCDFMAVLRGAL